MYMNLYYSICLLWLINQPPKRTPPKQDLIKGLLTIGFPLKRPAIV